MIGYRTAASCLALALVAAFARAQGAAVTSPYAGQEGRAIKSLSDDDVTGLLEGHGVGLARAAELNHYPGPRHVLDLAGPLGLTDAQVAATRKVYDAMHAEAVELGAALVGQERRLDAAFAGGSIDETTLATMVAEAARLQGGLRVVHLRAHIAMRGILTPEQVTRYDALRGYGEGGPAAHQH